ncbi:UNKNOWN [Stylonychia lemnae]|uniref:Uncharacterized protein n=1 Tax=Stylonychia lemnae TaxID=5949 RepID=A0A078B9N6_STYLE|nr:UNKNOWN [Stylonychia lemnae]|eukprot:CDW90891.1 UNKNOWN [Stylonychia lemnae]
MNEKSSANRKRYYSGRPINPDQQTARRAEIELKQFDKPVLDFEVNRTSRIKNKSRAEKSGTTLRGIGGISDNLKPFIEQNVSGSGFSNKQNEDQTPYSNINRASTMLNSYQQNVPAFSENGLMISPIQNHREVLSKQASQAELRQSMKNEIKRRSLCKTFLFTIGSLIFLSLAFIVLGFRKYDMIVSLFIADAEETDEKYVIPYYSQKMIFSCIVFAISSIQILTTNLISYRKYGVFQQSEFYTVPYETLKTLQIFLCLIGSLLLQIAFITYFYSLDEILRLGFNTSISTSILSLLSMFTVLFHYLFFGKRVAIIQKFGLFVSLLAFILLLMSLSEPNPLNIDKIAQQNYETYMLLGLIVMIVILVTSILQIQYEIKDKGQIKFTTSTSVILFFHGLSSVVSILIMVGQDQLYYKDDINGISQKEITTQMIFINFGAIFFTVGMHLISQALNKRNFSRIYLFLVFVPLFHLLQEYLLDKSKFDAAQIASHLSLVFGSFLIVIGEPKHSYEHLYQNQNENNSKSQAVPLLQDFPAKVEGGKKNKRYKTKDDFFNLEIKASINDDTIL